MSNPIWLDPQALASPLVTAFIDEFGLEKDPTTGKTPLDWFPTTVRAELMELVKGQHIPQPVMDRLMAGLFIIKSDRFYNVLPDFVEMANVLSGAAYDPELFDPADAAECLWAVTEAMLLDGGNEPYSKDITTYIAKAFEHEGMARVPEPAKKLADEGGWHEPAARYSGDDALFGQVQTVQADRYRDMEEWYTRRMQLCHQQFAALRLKNGKQPHPDVFKSFLKD